MQVDEIYKSLTSCNHPPELAVMMAKSIQKGVMLATLVGSILFIFLFQNYIPTYLLASWLVLQLLLAIVRIFIAKKLEYYTLENDLRQVKYMRLSIVTTVMSALLWGSISWMAILYAPDIYTYYALVMIMGLTAGSTTTLGSIFHAYIAFMWTVLLMFSASFIYYGGEEHLMVALISLVAITFLTGTGADYYQKLRKIVELGIELTRFNVALEERVQKEVSKNIEKDIQLMHQARLAQMGEMVSMIAHQWRQPLHIISTAATDMDLKIQFGTIDDTVCRKNIETINTLTQHLSHTIDDFRDFFKVTKEMEKTTLDTVVNVTLKIVKEYVENKKIKITTDLDGKVQFNSYPNELKQVLINLLKNAEDALLEKDVKDAQITIVTFSDDKAHHLEVCDNAGGIDAELLDKIFNAYFTTKEEGKGTGLGLYMSKKIIEEHCFGSLRVFNRDKGACFSISLPK